MKFDCVKFSGKVDYVRHTDRISGGYKANVSINGAVIPKLQLTNKLYDELEAGENMTLYGVFKNKRKKEENDGFIYGLQKESGEKMFATHYRYQVPIFMAFTAAIAFCLTFVAGWFASIFPVLMLFGKDDPNYMYNTTVFATIEATMVAAFFLWRAWLMFSVTADPESWETIEPATLSSRFSKFYK